MIFSTLTGNGEKLDLHARLIDTFSPHDDTKNSIIDFQEGIPADYQQYYSAVGAFADEAAQNQQGGEKMQQGHEYSDPNQNNGEVYEEITTETGSKVTISCSLQEVDRLKVPTVTALIHTHHCSPTPIRQAFTIPVVLS